MNTIYITEIKDASGEYTETFVNQTLKGAEEDLIKSLGREWDEEYTFVSIENLKKAFETVDMTKRPDFPLIKFSMVWRCDTELSGSVTVRKIELGK